MSNHDGAIPTFYHGVQFRSRAEARWAAFFDRMGWPWVYEPVDLAGYIPDFIVVNDGEHVLVEVKGGALDRAQLEEQAEALEARGAIPDGRPLWLLGAFPLDIGRGVVGRLRSSSMGGRVRDWCDLRASPDERPGLRKAWAWATNATQWRSPEKAWRTDRRRKRGDSWGSG